MYALCAQATESGLYAEMPEILSQLTTMRQGLEAAYLKLAIPLYEYRQFVTKKDDNASSPPNQATNLEEVLVRANITWEALLNLVNQRVNTEFGFQKSVLLPSTPTPKVLVEGNKKSELTTAFIEGGEENAEMGTQKQEKE